ncbi:MAG: hypothetical protein WBW31_12370, partial [Candidatus Sulfotelmatobacter sp.]
NELYHAWGGSGGGDIHYTWGVLLCLVGLEQLMDANPWDGLRFGALDPGAQGRLDRVTWQDHIYSVSVGGGKTEVARDGRVRLQADAGIVVRSYEKSSSRVSMRIESKRDFQLAISEFDAGPVKVVIDAKSVLRLKLTEGTASFAVPRGEHVVELTR